MANSLKLSPPWVAYQRKLEALFKGDKDIEVGQLYDYDDRIELWIYVHTEKKFRALNNLLPTYPDMGNVKFKIVLKFQDGQEHDDFQDVKDLFEGNPNVENFVEGEDIAHARHLFVQFKPEVVQFWNDNMYDLNGNWNGLMQDIAIETFDMGYNGVHFTTAPIEGQDRVAMPLGEWP